MNQKAVYTLGQQIEGVGAFIGAAVDGTLTGLLHSNEATNAIKALGKKSRAVLSPVEMISRYAHDEGVGLTDAFAQTFMEDTTKALRNGAKEAAEASYDWSLNNLKKGKMAGGLVGIGLATGIAGGLTHDTAGNPDIAGLPGI